MSEKGRKCRSLFPGARDDVLRSLGVKGRTLSLTVTRTDQGISLFLQVRIVRLLFDFTKQLAISGC